MNEPREADSPEAEAPLDADRAAPNARRGASVGLRLALVLVTPLLALLFLASRPRLVDLSVDNGDQAPLLVSVNGHELGEVPRGSARTFEGIPAGTWNLVATQLGPEGQQGRAHEAQAEVTADFLQSRPTWVWNVAGLTPHYAIVTQGFGDQVSEVFPPERFDPPAEVFRTPEGVLPGVNANMPPRVQVGRGETGAIRRVMWTPEHLGDVTRSLNPEPMGFPGATPPPQLLTPPSDPSDGE